MKINKRIIKTGLITILSLVFTCQLKAQADSMHIKPGSGGFAHLFLGPAYFKSQTMTDYLKKNDILGPTYSPSDFGNTMGLECNKIHGRFIMGAGAFGIATIRTSTNKGEAAINTGGGYLKLGYKFLQRPNLFMFGYANLGGFAHHILLSNFSDTDSIHFNTKAPVIPSRKQSYLIKGVLLDVGISLKTLPWTENLEILKIKRAFMLGVDAGLFVGLPLGDWTNYTYVVKGPPDLDLLLSPYIRFTFGFGYFKD